MNQIQLITNLITGGGKALGGMDDAAKIFPFGDYWTAISLGQIPNVTRASGIGFNPDVDTATTPEDAWGGSGLYPWMSVPTSLEIVSASANDAGAGSGARTVLIVGLDANYASISQTVTLNGLTAVAIPLQLLRINAIRCMTGAVNAGDVTVRDAGGGATRGIVLTGIGVANQAPYTVPAGFTLAIRQIILSIDSDSGTINKFASIRTYFKSPTTAPILSLQIGNTNGQPYNHFAAPPVMVNEKTDFSLRIVKASDNNTSVTAGWNGSLHKNS